MALQALRGNGFYYPTRIPMHVCVDTTTDPISYANTTLTTSTSKVQFSGTLEWADGGTGKTISTVLVSLTSIASASASDSFRASLQTPTTPARRGDGTLDRYGAVAATSLTEGFNSITMTDGTETYDNGANIVIVFDWASYAGGTTTLQVVCADTRSTSPDPAVSGATTMSAGIPNVAVIASDSTMGIIRGGTLFESCGHNPNVGNITFNTGTTYDEYGIVFQVPFACQVDGLWFFLSQASNAQTIEASIWTDPTGTPSLSRQWNNVGSDRLAFTVANNIRLGHLYTSSPMTLSPGTNYGCSIRALDTNDSRLVEAVIGTQSYGGPLPGGTTVGQIYRDGGTGAFTADMTKWIHMGVLVSALDNGAGGAGGLITHPGMTGGMRA